MSQARHIALAPGEDNIYTARVTTSLVLFWFKADLAVTNQRMHFRIPNTLLAVIPLGYVQSAPPLSGIGSIGSTARFSLWRAFWGIFWTLVGFMSFGSGEPVAIITGLVVTYLGVATLLNSWRYSLDVVAQGGAVTRINVSFIDRHTLGQFAHEAQARLFTNYEGLRHQETLGFAQAQMHQAQLNAQIQQAQMNAQLNAQMQFLAAAGLTGQAQDPRAVTQPQPASLPGNDAPAPTNNNGRDEEM